MSEETTQIPVKKKTRQKLRSISRKGQTYDELINKLIAVREELEDKSKFISWFENNFEIFGFEGIEERKGHGAFDYLMLKNGKEIKVEVEILSSKSSVEGSYGHDVDLLICLFEDKELPVETKEIIDFDISKKTGPSTEENTVEKILLLLELARMDANIKPREKSLEGLAQELGEDEATISLLLEGLYDNGLIEKESDSDGTFWSLTSEGVGLLRSLWLDLKGIFDEVSGKIKLVGRIVSGFGEGSYYMSKERYQKQFKEKLGFKPYPGTLDIKLNTGSLKLKKWLELENGINIEGFSTEERSFGGAECFPAKIKGEKAAAVLPFRTHHENDVLELISPVKIRDKYDLEDGDELEVVVEV